MSTSDTKVFDPLAVEHIGVTLGVELVQQILHTLPPPTEFEGAGVYALYYCGGHPAYADLVALDAGQWRYPVYIGKAVRKNAKQGFNPKPTTDKAIYSRLQDHASSIESTDLKLGDFRCRYIVINDAFIGLAESVLITLFRPPWNGMGIGNKVVGKNRTAGTPSLWDALHPGRGGRPAGAERYPAALKKIAASVKALQQEPSDPQTRWMLQRIRRFI
jgi:hypothetical protein